MFNKKIFALVTGYVAGSIISSLFSKKKGDQLKKDMNKAKKSGRDEKGVLIGNFVETHKELLDFVKKEYFTEKNKKKLLKKKDEFLKIAADFKKEGEIIINDIVEGSPQSIESAKKRIHELYELKKNKVQTFSKNASPKLSELKDYFLDLLQDVPKKVKKKVSNFKNKK